MLDKKPIRTAARLITALSALLTAGAHAQSYPARPITLIAPYSPGTASDLISRSLAKGISDGGGMRVVVENKDGASGNIAVDYIIKSAPDGYTLMLGSTNVVINLFTMRVSYDMSNFTALSLVGTIPNSLIVSGTVPARNIAELVAMAKSRPGQLAVATGGPTGVGTFLAESFKKAAGVDLQLIPYKGSSLAVADLLAGRTHLLFAPIATGLPHVNAGKARIMGVTGVKRSTVIPDVPTFVEAGYPMLDIPSWFGVMGPAGLPAPILGRLNGEIVKAIASRDVMEQFFKVGIDASPNTPAEFSAFLKDQVGKWGKAVQDSGFRIQ